MILIVGATGALGHEATLQLLDAGYPVRAMVRTPAKAVDLIKQGAEVVQGDLTKPTTIRQACQGVDVVVASAHSLLGRGKYSSDKVDSIGHRSLIDAAKAAGVSQFIYTSISGVSPGHPVDFYRTKYHVEQYLNQSGIPHTILRPSAFMEWHAHNLLGKSILEKGTVTILGRGNTPTNFVAVRDVAYLIRQSIQNPEYYNRIITIGGPSNPTKNEVASLYGRLAGIPPKVKHVPGRTLQVLSKIISPIHPGIGRIMYMSAILDNMDCSLDMTETLSKYAMKLTSIEEFVQEQVARHQQRQAVPS
ncbi:SDR family oxidoreductase [Telluribacter sp. SYSU D00476]|uniref:SDR family oxidoreductase n=1 Tax=Telluribacter sp. SYSU D00476 TaxID=2811430 RepID=UPI001FF682C5|nr:SDR family oxidoreductase [Telluribacter sp. SYSU D00476]